jgi:hypothetical protein
MALREMVDHLRQLVAHKKQALKLAYEQRIAYLGLFAKDPDVLKKARGRRTQREISERTGLTQAHVSELERGRQDQIGEERLLRVLEVYSELEDDSSGH